MTNDEVIEKVINVLYHDKVKPLRDVLYDILEVSKAEDEGKSFLLANTRLTEILENNDIIEKTNLNRKELTHFAKTVYESGGWIKYNTDILNEKIRKEEIEKKRYRTPIILTIIGLLLVGMQIYQGCKQGGQQQEIQNLSREKDSLYSVTTGQTLLLKNQDKEIIKIKTILDSLIDSLSVDKKVKKK
jgi:hypothetical protein